MITLLLISISLLGLILLIWLYLTIRTVSSRVKLNKYRSKDKGLADLLNYATIIDDGVILGKNGSLMAAWIYKGKDLASCTPIEREEVSTRINKAISSLGDGWMLHIDAARFSSPSYPDRNSNFFPNAITQAIDEERRQLFESIGTLYEGFFVMVVTYFPPLLAEKKFTELMFDDEEEGTSSIQDQTLQEFNRNCKTLESNLSISLNLSRLGEDKVVLEDGTTIIQDDFLRWLQFCITGRNHPINLPKIPMYIDSLIGGQEFWPGTVPMIGNKYIQIVAIDGFALESYPGILARLAELPIEYRWSNRFIFLDQHQAIAHLEKYRKKWKQKIRGFVDQVFNLHTGDYDQDAEAMVDDANAALAEVKAGLVGQGYYTSVIVLLDEDRSRLETIARLVEKEINSLGFSARVETINTVEAWLGSLPGHGVENIRRPILSTLNFADLIPTSTIWTGHQTNPCQFYPPNSPALMQVVTSGSTPFRFNLHVGDVGHTLIFGATGAGKSTLMATLAAQAQRYKGALIYAFDKGRSLETLVKACDGAHFDFADCHSIDDLNGLQLAPLKLIEDKKNLPWAAGWIETILELNNITVTSQHRNDIEITLQNNANNNSYTLSDFSNTIQNPEIREVLRSYTVDGSMGYLLDAKVDNLELSNFSCFEIEELMNLPDKYKLPIMLYLFRRIELSLTGAPAYIFIDEAWIVLGNPVFKEKIREWLKVNRKKNCAVVMATQSLSDATNSGILDVLNESCLTKIYLPNPAAREEDARLIYTRMGLNQRQIDIIATAIPKQQYYYVSPQGCRLFELDLQPLSLAFVAVSDQETLSEVQNYISLYDKDWSRKWLANRDIELNNFLKG